MPEILNETALVEPVAGQLIRAADWTAVVKAVKALVTWAESGEGRAAVLVQVKAGTATVPGASVTLDPGDAKDLSPHVATWSATLQRHVADGVLPGTYALTVEVPGYEPVRSTLKVPEGGGRVAADPVALGAATQVRVPDLAGLTLAEAAGRVADAGLDQGTLRDALGTPVPGSADGMKSARVLAQYPPAGSLADPKAKVDAYVARDVRPSVVLAVTEDGTKDPVEDAVATLVPADDRQPVRSARYAGAAAGVYAFEAVALGEYTLTIAAPGFVDHHADLKVGPDGIDRKVRLKANRPDRVPDVFGGTVEQAEAAIAGANLKVGQVIDAHGAVVQGSAVTAALRSRLVLGQSPAAGTRLAAGGPVHLVIAAQAELVKPVKVPKVVGRTVMQAKADLEAQGLKWRVEPAE